MKPAPHYIRLALFFFFGVSVFASFLWAGDTAIVDGQNAEEVWGKLTETALGFYPGDPVQ
ncbi:MAG: hypothetical protein IPN90_13860 [Elusimicrobia bacterium]|nr:hypothetical protein [Elusimicrobiota bacterium]